MNYVKYKIEFSRNSDRDVAQFGSAPRLGRGGRTFESCHPDHLKRLPKGSLFFHEIIHKNYILRISFNLTIHALISSKESLEICPNSNSIKSFPQTNISNIYIYFRKNIRLLIFTLCNFVLLLDLCYIMRGWQGD